VFVGIPETGRYTAEVQRSITKEQVFDGEQERYQVRLSGQPGVPSLLNDMGFADMALDLTDLAVEDDAARRASADTMAGLGTIRHGEHRKAHGFGLIPEADQGVSADDAAQDGKVPAGWNNELLFVPSSGAQVSPGDGQQGLRPGLAGRGQRSNPSSVEASVAQLHSDVTGVSRTAAARAVRRAATLPQG
jgi:hypothetical protein